MLAYFNTTIDNNILLKATTTTTTTLEHMLKQTCQDNIVTLSIDHRVIHKGISVLHPKALN